MSTSEKSKIVFSDVFGSELYWNLRCKVKEELLKSKATLLSQTHQGSVEELITKMVKDLNLESELKNRIYDIFDSKLKEETPYTWAKFKLRDCVNPEMLPFFFTHPQEETLECIVQARSDWNDLIKSKVSGLMATYQKPIIRA
jgi:hypothetical protein